MTNKLFSTKIIKYAKKYKAIQKLGGRCEKCEENRFFTLTFHHIENNKEYNLSKLFHEGFSWKIIEKEIEKCQLLCFNCHMEIHHGGDESINNISKKIHLDYIRINGCSKCGYDKCKDSLTFHHLRDKIIKIGKCRTNNINKIKENVISELNKCIVLCQNCHSEIHSDLYFFEKNKDLIIEKSNNIKERVKIDKDILKKMYFIDGMKQKDIVKYFNCSKSAISDIIKKMK